MLGSVKLLAMGDVWLMHRDGIVIKEDKTRQRETVRHPFVVGRSSVVVTSILDTRLLFVADGWRP